MPLSTVFTDAMNLISDPDHWIKGDLAVDANDKSVNTLSPEAVKFCTSGALFRVCKRDAGLWDEAVCTFRTLNRLVSVSRWNDALETTHDDVMRAFRRAIKELRAS